VAAVAAAVSLIMRFRRARRVERQQLKWLAYAMGVLMVAPVVQDSWLGGWAAAAAALTLFAIPAAIGVAILRYRLYDIDRLINRTLVYGLLTALLAGVYSGAVLVSRVVSSLHKYGSLPAWPNVEDQRRRWS
jgi:Zn-dependent protease with chaperone function